MGIEKKRCGGKGSTIKEMYKNIETPVKIAVEISKEFEVKVRLQPGFSF